MEKYMGAKLMSRALGGVLRRRRQQHGRPRGGGWIRWVGAAFSGDRRVRVHVRAGDVLFV